MGPAALPFLPGAIWAVLVSKRRTKSISVHWHVYRNTFFAVAGDAKFNSSKSLNKINRLWQQQDRPPPNTWTYNPGVWEQTKFNTSQCTQVSLKNISSSAKKQMEVGICPNLGLEYASAHSCLIMYSPEFGLNVCFGLFFTYLIMKKQMLLGPSSLDSRADILLLIFIILSLVSWHWAVQV